ncbi:MAG: BamA/TamA family outer membrane protein [Candidatus Bipolaricaulota bacterium]|nr:BamA/TamA family outer membrane protein [Candidatus Bipolaricaulota bacterium]
MKTLAVLVVVALGATGTLAQEFTVGRLEAVGNVHVPAKEILGATGIQAGQVVTRAQVLAAEEAIRKLGYFVQVKAELAFEGDQVVLRFRVVEYPKLERITFEGLPPAPKGQGTLVSWFREALRGGYRPGETKLREILTDKGIKKGEVLNVVKLEGAVAALVEEYRKADLATVQIVPDLRGAELVIRVEELPVVGHRFRGLATIPEEEARKLVEVPVGEPGRISAIQKSLGALGRSVFFASGGVGAELGDGGVWLVWTLTERVVLPAPAPVVGIELSGVTAFPPERVQARVGALPPGSVTNHDVLRALAPVYDLYRREGLFMVDFVGEGAASGRLRVLVKEGRIGRIEVAEGSRTADWVIRRVLGLHPGELLTEGKFTAARQALMALGYFQDVVLDPQWAADELVLRVSATDLEKLGSITGNLAFSPQEGGIVGQLTYSQKNLLGRAIDLSLSLDQGLVKSSGTTWSLSFTSHSFPVFDRVSLDLYRRESGEDPKTVTVGGGATVAYPLAPYLDLSLGLTSEQAWELPDWNLLDPRTAVELGIEYDDRDSPFFPRTGSRGRAGVEKAGTFAPGVEYLTLKGELARFVPADIPFLLGDHRAVLAWRALARWGWDLPERYRFTLGGVDSVRGAKGVKTDRYGLFNLEYRIEIAQGSWIALFSDFGATWDGTVKASAGVELAASVAGMFVRIALAWPNDRDPTWVPAFEFGMSPMF